MSVVYSIGEALIDFIPTQKGVALKDVPGFEKAAGGAPANVACAVSKLGGRSSFIGMLGEDAFGDFLVETLKAEGVDTRYVFRTKEANTSLAFVSLKEDGNRDFSFYRNPGADMLLQEEHVAQVPFQPGDILHYCSVDLIEAPVKYAHKKAIQSITGQGGIISFDPNVRLPLWPSREECRRTILEFIPLSHILKISDEELAFITGIENEREAIASLFVGSVQYVIYTKGSAGSEWHSRQDSVAVPALKVQAVDTTGAGDAFIGSVLYQLQLRNISLNGWDAATAKEVLKFANAAAASTTLKKGAIASFPTHVTVE